MPRKKRAARRPLATKQEILDYFGGAIATAAAFDISHQAVYEWSETPPRGRQAEFLLMKQEATAAS